MTAAALPAWQICHYCDDVAAGQDHIVPQSLLPKGSAGLTASANLVPACRSCNSRKGNNRSTCECSICSGAWQAFGVSMVTQAAAGSSIDPEDADKLATYSRQVEEGRTARDALICQARARGAGVRAIGRAANLSHATVIAILKRDKP